MTFFIDHSSPRTEARDIFLESAEAAFVNSSRFINATLRLLIWAGVWIFLSLADGLKLLDRQVAPIALEQGGAQ